MISPWNGQQLETYDAEDGFQKLCTPGVWPWPHIAPRTCPCPSLCRACGAPSLCHVEVHLQHGKAGVHGGWLSFESQACIQPHSGMSAKAVDWNSCPR